MREPVLRLLRQPRGGEHRHHAAADQLSHAVLGRTRTGRERVQRSRPERRAHDRCVLQHRSILGGDRVEPGRDHTVHRGGHGVGREVSSGVAQHPHELERVQRVPAGALEQRVLDLVGDLVSAQQLMQQRARLLGGELGEPDGVAPPPDVPLRELRARRTQHQRRRPLQGAHEMFDRLQQAGLRPMEILELDDDRAGGGRVRQDPGARRRRLVRGGVRPLSLALAVGRDAQQRLQAPEEPRAVGRVDGDAIRERPHRDPRDVSLGTAIDPRRGAHHVAQRSERHAVPVREARTGEPRDVRPELPPELPRQARLPDAGVGNDRDRLGRPSRIRQPEPFPEHGELALPSDQRCDLLRRRRATFAQHPPDPDRGRLPLDADGVLFLGHEAFPDRAPRLLPDHEPVARRHRLHPARRVHHVAGDGLADLRALAERDDRLARVHRDADRDVGVGFAELSHRAEEVEPRPHRALGVVPVGHRCAEHPHRRVADEFVQRAPEALDRVLRAFVERHERATHILGIGLVRSRREPHEVGEQDRDEPAFLDRSGARLQRCAARHAETGVRGDRRAAARTHHVHRGSLRKDEHQPVVDLTRATVRGAIEPTVGLVPTCASSDRTAGLDRFGADAAPRPGGGLTSGDLRRHAWKDDETVSGCKHLNRRSRSPVVLPPAHEGDSDATHHLRWRP